MNSQFHKPWLIAVWPGMGGVAQIAGGYLVRQLGAQPIAELDPGPYFEIQSISIKHGVVQPNTLPRSTFYYWRDPAEQRDIIVLLGDRQPTTDGYRYCQALLDAAAKFDVERVFTFAAMATPILPAQAPRVFGVCTREDMLDELRRDGVTLLDEGEIAGLNGVFIAAAAARELPGACLLGEFPFFAATAPNPKASAAVLRVFAELSGLTLDLTEIDADARKVERGLIQHLEGLQRAAQLAAQASRPPNEEQETLFPAPADGDAETEGQRDTKPRRISPEVRERIEQLFAATREDRSKALELKAELDRFELFKQFEDRFLDLFKQAG
ncbi:MAG: PAC2 family protein [Planctomycetes bacterium]|nr:PAC2 family protein [Planctomycetota bacterium]